MPKRTAEYCRNHLVKCSVHSTIAGLFQTWEQVSRFKKGVSLQYVLSTDEISKQALEYLKESLYPHNIMSYFNIPNFKGPTPEECKQYLINSFVHPLIAGLFTTWEEVVRFEDGEPILNSLTTEESINSFNELKKEKWSKSLIDFFDQNDT